MVMQDEIGKNVNWFNSVNSNFIETSKALNLNLNDVKILIKNSFKSSFLDEKNKINWLNKML